LGHVRDCQLVPFKHTSQLADLVRTDTAQQTVSTISSCKASKQVGKDTVRRQGATVWRQQAVNVPAVSPSPPAAAAADAVNELLSDGVCCNETLIVT